MNITRVLGTVVLGAAIAGCNRAPAGPPPGQGMPPTPVVLATAHAAPIEDASEYVASLKSLRSTTVQPQIDGQITKILVAAGDRVRQGAPLMEIDARRQQAAVSSQQAELAAAEAALNFARQQQQRNNELYAAGAISKQQLEQTDTAQRTADANLKALQAQVQQQEVQLRFFTITAPTSGVVGDVPVRVGNQVTTQTLLTTIDQNDTLEVNASVPIERAAALKLGLPLQIWSSDGSQRIAATTVSFVSPHADDQTQSVLVKGNVQESGRRAARGAIRPRAHRLEDRRRARRAGDRGVARQRPASSRSWPSPRLEARLRPRSSGRSRSGRSSATTTRCSKASRPATRSSCPARRNWPTASRSRPSPRAPRRNSRRPSHRHQP